MNDSILDRISEEQFLNAYNKYPPNKWIKLAFKYYSLSTLKEDMWVKRITNITLISLFLLGITGAIIGLKHTIVAIPTFTLAVFLGFLGIFRFGAFFMNNYRLRKIRKKLQVTKLEYDFLENVYLES